LAADALKEAIKNYRSGKKINLEEPVISQTCTVVSEPKEIIGKEDFVNKGVYKDYSDLEKFKNQRVLVVENGEPSIKLAIDLTQLTGRVIFITPLKNVIGSDEILIKLKRSDVKVLKQSALLEIMGTGSVEKVKIHDLDEDEEYELFVDSIIFP